MFKQLSLADAKSGFLIFLIALPLSLGIAMASSAPPVAGLITAMVGGILVSFFGSSRLTIKGPAAGLIVIILGAIADLGQGDLYMGYKKCLAVGVAAAVLQIILSRVGAGKVGKLMPPSVIHGMLAAIGVIIIAKQLHILLGVVPHSKTPLELIAEIPESLMNANPEIIFIGALTLSTVIFFPFIPSSFTKKVPPALISLALVLPLALYWHLDTPHDYSFLHHNYHVGPDLLVQLPANFLGSFSFPDFSGLMTWVGWKYVIMLALVGSLESLLTVTAIDSLDPKRQKSDLNADLLATGIGNLFSSLIGGLPMISEVVRSKANIDNGAQSQWSNFFHGVFILLAVTLLGSVIHEIPLSALAALLIITGFRLSSPKEFFKTYRIGTDQLVLFIVTLGMTLKTDLLVGVFSGLLLKILIHIARGAQIRHLLKTPVRIVDEPDGTTTTIHVEGPAIFSNYLHFSKCLDSYLSDGKKIIIDLSKAKIIDHTTLCHLKELSRILGDEKVQIKGLHVLKAVSGHELATHRLA